MADETAPPKNPIFFGITWSFLLGWFPALLTLFDVLFVAYANPETTEPVAGVIAFILNVPLMFVGTVVTPEDVHMVMRGLSPLYALWVAYQRSGPARPYALLPTAENVK